MEHQSRAGLEEVVVRRGEGAVAVVLHLEVVEEECQPDQVVEVECYHWPMERVGGLLGYLSYYSSHVAGQKGQQLAA